MAVRPRSRSRWPLGCRKTLPLGLILALLAPGLALAVAPASPAPDAALSADAAGSMAAFGAEDLYLDTTLDGNAMGLVHFGWKANALWATPATLRRLGFAKLPAADAPLRLASLPGVTLAFDRAAQSVAITAPLAGLGLPTARLGYVPRRAVHASTAPGILFNYSLYGTWSPDAGGTQGLSAYTEWRAFGRFGILASTALTQATDTGTGWDAHSVRLDTSWSHSFPDALLTLRIGDTLTAATAWSRPTRIGGIQLGTDFSLQPYAVTTPLPSFFGQATLPSQVELYINGMKQYSGSVPAGPFMVGAVPGINGAGNAQMVVTDALGRITTLDFPLYDTHRLLRAGLADWSVELGAVREGYGIDSFDYASQPVASATWRRGLTNAFTLETHAEAAPGLANAGAGGAWLIGSQGGVLSGSFAASRGPGQSGRQVGLGYAWTDARYTLTANALWASPGYRDIASGYGGPPPRLTLNAQAGVNLPHAGSLGLGYVRLVSQSQDSRYASAYWSRSLWHGATLSASLNLGLGQTHDRTVFLSLSLPIDDRTFASASLQQSGGRAMLEADATRSVPASGGWGWRVGATQDGQGAGGQAELDVLGRYGQAEVGVHVLPGNDYAYAGASGSIIWMGGGLFAARQVTDGFAVVSTSGVPGVPVLLENDPVGTTNARGLLLAPQLRAWQDNRISINPLSLPADMRLGAVSLDATPAAGAGSLVRFDIARVHAGEVVLYDTHGKPLPIGSEARLRGHAHAASVVGFDGVAYFDTLQPHNEIVVTTPRTTCSAVFDYPTHATGIPRIGPLACRPTHP